MLSVNQKRAIAAGIQQLLGATNNAELPDGEIEFCLQVHREKGLAPEYIRNNGSVITDPATKANASPADDEERFLCLFCYAFFHSTRTAGVDSDKPCPECGLLSRTHISDAALPKIRECLRIAQPGQSSETQHAIANLLGIIDLLAAAIPICHKHEPGDLCVACEMERCVKAAKALVAAPAPDTLPAQPRSIPDMLSGIMESFDRVEALCRSARNDRPVSETPSKEAT